MSFLIQVSEADDLVLPSSTQSGGSTWRRPEKGAKSNGDPATPLSPVRSLMTERMQILDWVWSERVVPFGVV